MSTNPYTEREIVVSSPNHSPLSATVSAVQPKQTHGKNRKGKEPNQATPQAIQPKPETEFRLSSSPEAPLSQSIAAQDNGPNATPADAGKAGANIVRFMTDEECRAHAQGMKSEELAEYVAKGGWGYVLLKLIELKPYIEVLWERFDRLVGTETIAGCRTKSEFCDVCLHRSIRAVQYMLYGRTPNTPSNARSRKQPKGGQDEAVADKASDAPPTDEAADAPAHGPNRVADGAAKPNEYRSRPDHDQGTEEKKAAGNVEDPPSPTTGGDQVPDPEPGVMEAMRQRISLMADVVEMVKTLEKFVSALIQPLLERHPYGPSSTITIQVARKSHRRIQAGDWLEYTGGDARLTKLTGQEKALGRVVGVDKLHRPRIQWHNEQAKPYSLVRDDSVLVLFDFQAAKEFPEAYRSYWEDDGGSPEKPLHEGTTSEPGSVTLQPVAEEGPGRPPETVSQGPSRQTDEIAQPPQRRQKLEERLPGKDGQPLGSATCDPTTSGTPEDVRSLGPTPPAASGGSGRGALLAQESKTNHQAGLEEPVSGPGAEPPTTEAAGGGQPGAAGSDGDEPAPFSPGDWVTFDSTCKSLGRLEGQKGRRFLVTRYDKKPKQWRPEPTRTDWIQRRLTLEEVREKFPGAPEAWLLVRPQDATPKPAPCPRSKKVYEAFRGGPEVLEVTVSGKLGDAPRLKYYVCAGEQKHPYQSLDEAIVACDEVAEGTSGGGATAPTAHVTTGQASTVSLVESRPVPETSGTKGSAGISPATLPEDPSKQANETAPAARSRRSVGSLTVDGRTAKPGYVCKYNGVDCKITQVRGGKDGGVSLVRMDDGTMIGVDPVPVRDLRFVADPKDRGL